ncbi:MAG: peptidoglycan DD-metalloendopeptidase family protein, partial [Acidimicrobiales bacterium]
CIDPARLNRLIADFEAAAAEEAAALEELGVALEVLERLNAQLDALRVRLGEVQLRLSAARVDVGFAEIREQVAAETLEDVSTELAYQEERLRSQAVDAYMGGDDVELATSAALLSLDNYADVETARTYASAVLGDQLATVDQVDALREAVVILTEVVAEIEAATQVEVKRVGAIELQVEALIDQQDELVAQSELETELVAEDIAGIQARKQVYANELRITGVGGGPIGETLRSRQADQEAPANPFRSFELPLESTRIASPFGPRVHPIFLDTRLHAGVDMTGSAGEPILAAGDGVVVYAQEARGYGNTVVIDHGNTLGTLYAHMTADTVFVGMEVVAGDIIGFVGSTGFSTGPHLHFEVRIKGQPVDPMPYLNLGEPS